MSSTHPTEAADGGQLRVSTLELFFDLVFVFTIIQLSHVYTHHPGWVEFGQVALMFGVIWWMYSGYVWLTNEVAPSTSVRRTWLMVGMFGFLVIALAVPEAFHGSGLAFGLGYLLVNTVHTGLFYSNGGASVTPAVVRLAAFNGLSAGLVVAGGLIHGWPRYALWALAILVQIVTPYLIDTSGFVIRASHFCERHGLVVIIAIGESILAVGSGLAGLDLTLGLAGMVALALTLAYVLWWAFFGFDDERGEQVLGALPAAARPRAAVLAYGYALIPLVIGIVMTAAGLQLSIGEGGARLPAAAALALSGGVALFFVGQWAFRLVLGLPRPWWRLIAALATVATAGVGAVWVAWAQLVALILVAYGFVIADDIVGVRGGEHSRYLPSSPQK
ncbi:Predicted membrane protein [Nocardia otitidiscaviarum]|uniref:Predicted membrane protein n=1 Tax=Nocardia otitidiscaviarum TaxID=1823 RepID=A0A379JIP3_9NOCA|nr:low temperature requirement protein A [Nocardia otitidiscaviarum]SUD48355.1 Predicted membrane protein [Nocardia otitidiscaviarum]